MLGSWPDHARIVFLLAAAFGRFLDQILIELAFLEEVLQNFCVCTFWTCTAGVYCVVSAMNFLHFFDFVSIHGWIFDSMHSIW